MDGYLDKVGSGGEGDPVGHLHLFFLFSTPQFVKGVLHLELCAQRMRESEDFFIVPLLYPWQGPRSVSFV